MLQNDATKTWENNNIMADDLTIESKIPVDMPELAIDDNHINQEGVQQGRRFKCLAIKEENKNKCCISWCGIVSGIIFEGAFINLANDFYKKGEYIGVGGCAIGSALSLVLILGGIKIGCKTIR